MTWQRQRVRFHSIWRLGGDIAETASEVPQYMEAGR